MINKKTIRIGLLGAGTVGQSLIKMIEKERERIYKNHGVNIEILKIGDRSFEKKEILKKYNCTKDLNEVISDPDIDIVVELIGGIYPAKELVIGAITNGKSVVTANKALLANEGKTIFNILKEQQNKNILITIGFEAAVGGALPIIKNLRRIWSFGNIKSIGGILNGTCNYIITKMEEGLDYSIALKKAQDLGFAEADPTFDISGRDAGQKLAIISSLGFSTWIEEKDIKIEGIENIHTIDHIIANKWNMVIRLLAITKYYEEQLLLRVHPVLISKNHLLADVKNENNAIYIEEEYSGSTFIVGRGAGGFPTASAVLADIISIASGSRNIWFNEFSTFNKIEDAIYRFYLRFQTVDRPGVLASISRVLAEHKISIASMHQEEGVEPVNVVIFTYESKESDIFNAIQIINKMNDIILSPTIVIRVLN